MLFRSDGSSGYCKAHRNAGQQIQHQQKPEEPSRSLLAARGDLDGQVGHHKTSEQVFSGIDVRTMNSSFQKSPDLSEKTIHLSELGRHKKAEPKRDELRKVLGEVLGEEEYDYEEKTGMPIKVEEKKQEENNSKNILKPGEKIKFGQ